MFSRVLSGSLSGGQQLVDRLRAVPPESTRLYGRARGAWHGLRWRLPGSLFPLSSAQTPKRKRKARCRGRARGCTRLCAASVLRVCRHSTCVSCQVLTPTEPVTYMSSPHHTSRSPRSEIETGACARVRRGHGRGLVIYDLDLLDLGHTTPNHTTCTLESSKTS